MILMKYLIMVHRGDGECGKNVQHQTVDEVMVCNRALMATRQVMVDTVCGHTC